jgi:acetyl esterase/lipase
MSHNPHRQNRHRLRGCVRAVGIAALVMLLAGCDAVIFGAINLASEKRGYGVHEGILFESAQGLRLDVYQPVDAHHAPVVVFFYGGRWEKGTRQEYRYVGAALAARGIVTVIPDYRKYPKVKLDGFMQDATAATGWTNTQIARYGGNPGSIFLMGHSSGAHIGALLATDASWLQRVGMQPRQLAGFIGLAGPYDFAPFKVRDLVGMFGSTPAEQRCSQPVAFVDGDEPPMLLLQGTDDHTVRPKNATSLANALRKHGESVALHLYPGVGHSGILLSLSRPFRHHDPALADTLAFIRAHSNTP